MPTEDRITIADGITLQQIDGISVYRIGTISRTAIDEWITTVFNVLQSCPTGQPYRVLYDFSDISILRLNTSRFHDVGTLGLTLEGNEQVIKILNDRPTLKVFLGIVMQPSLSSKMMKIINSAPPPYARKFYFSVDAAFEWLKSAR